jgi:FMN-dependent NADH-azoreductase
MNILRISCSPRGPSSESQRLSQKIVDRLLAREPAASVVERVIGDGSLAHVDANYALAQHSATAEVSALGGIAQSDVLIRELERSDVIVIATPMHNLGVPSMLKAWIDHVVRARRTFHVTAEGKVGALRDRPVFVAIASGGRFSGEQARQPDFLTPYLTVILGMIGLHDVRFFSVEGTGGGPEAVEAARARAESALEAHFAQTVQSG